MKIQKSAITIAAVVAVSLSVLGCSAVDSDRIELVVKTSGHKRGIEIQSVDCYICSSNGCRCQFMYNKRLYSAWCFEDRCNTFKLSVSD